MSTEGQNIQDIGEINRALAENYIHYDHSRTDYSINSFELEVLSEAGNSIWKDVCLFSYGIGIPCTISSVNKLLSDKGLGDSETFLNLLFAGLGLIIGTICLVVWKRSEKKFSKLISAIKNKPKFKLPTAKA
ncbi:MAG TPA: hypothetical protein PKJ83_17225 [Cyclobacteriaceae bacterium]|nr:hypothetical protein [Cyclobacteriaceae bacterium]HPW62902.1 hypothetical protein [Cyclobacteriaceae bacterium]